MKSLIWRHFRSICMTPNRASKLCSAAPIQQKFKSEYFIKSILLKKKFLDEVFFFVSKKYFEKSRFRFFACWSPEPPGGVIHRPNSKMSSKLFGRHVFRMGFPRFKLPGAFRNRFKTILLDQEMNFKKKIHRKTIFFSGRKTFSKKKLENFRFFFPIFKISRKKSTFSKKSNFFEKV